MTKQSFNLRSYLQKKKTTQSTPIITAKTDICHIISIFCHAGIMWPLHFQKNRPPLRCHLNVTCLGCDLRFVVKKECTEWTSADHLPRCRHQPQCDASMHDNYLQLGNVFERHLKLGTLNRGFRLINSKPGKVSRHIDKSKHLERLLARRPFK